jgi:hypothetical protein
MPYQVRGARPGAAFMTIACTRSAIARSESDISAIFASTTSSPSASFSVSFNAARSSVLSFLLICLLSLVRRPLRTLCWWLASVAAFGAGVAIFDDLVYGGPLTTGYSPARSRSPSARSGRTCGSCPRT